MDNLFDDDILEEVLRFARFSSPTSTSPSPPSPPNPSSTGSPSSSQPSYVLHRFSPQAVSEALCSRAKAVSEDQRAVTSPFQQRAMEEGIHYVGGKMDDISVLVGRIGVAEDSEVSGRD